MIDPEGKTAVIFKSGNREWIFTGLKVSAIHGLTRKQKQKWLQSNMSETRIESCI